MSLLGREVIGARFAPLAEGRCDWTGYILNEDGEEVVRQFAFASEESALQTMDVIRRRRAGESVPTLIVRVDGEIEDDGPRDEAPSYTRWQREVEEDRMREHLT
jgi:hypothetical protein